MDAMYSGLVIVPIIVGLVEVAKRLGLGAAYAAPLAVGLGLLISLGEVAGVPGAAWMDAGSVGLRRAGRIWHGWARQAGLGGSRRSRASQPARSRG